MEASKKSPGKVDLEEDICVHIFTVSAAMVGVCITVIGLLKIVITIQKVDTVADDLVAANALLYMAACFLSYWALRTRSSRRMHRLERVADGLFLVGLGITTGICCFMAYAMAIM